MRIRVELNEIETKKMYKLTNLKSCCFETLNKIDTLIKKREKTHINAIRNKKE